MDEFASGLAGGFLGGYAVPEIDRLQFDPPPAPEATGFRGQNLSDPDNPGPDPFGGPEPGWPADTGSPTDRTNLTRGSFQMPEPFPLAAQKNLERLSRGYSYLREKIDDGTLPEGAALPVMHKLRTQLESLQARKRAAMAAAAAEQQQMAMEQMARATALEMTNTKAKADALPGMVQTVTDAFTGQTAHLYPDGKGGFAQLTFDRVDAGQPPGETPAAQSSPAGSRRMTIWNGPNRTEVEYENGQIVRQQHFDANGRPAEQGADVPSTDPGHLSERELTGLRQQAERTWAHMPPGWQKNQAVIGTFNRSADFLQQFKRSEWIRNDQERRTREIAERELTAKQVDSLFDSELSRLEKQRDALAKSSLTGELPATAPDYLKDEKAMRAKAWELARERHAQGKAHRQNKDAAQPAKATEVPASKATEPKLAEPAKIIEQQVGLLAPVEKRLGELPVAQQAEGAAALVKLKGIIAAHAGDLTTAPKEVQAEAAKLVEFLKSIKPREATKEAAGIKAANAAMPLQPPLGFSF